MDSICKFTLQDEQCRIDAVNFVLERHPSRLGEHGYDAYGLHLICEGHGTVRFADRTYPLETGTMFWVEPSAEFSVSGESLSYYYVSFHCSTGMKAFDRNAERVRTGFNDLLPLWQTAMERCDTGNLTYLATGLVLYSLAFWLPHSTVKRSENQLIVQQIYDYVSTHFCDPDLSLKQLCTARFYNEAYVSSLFKKETGVSFAQYVRQLRITRACAYMERPDMSISEIACFTGFRDPLYFSKVFKTVMGCSPSEYRNAIKDD